MQINFYLVTVPFIGLVLVPEKDVWAVLIAGRLSNRGFK